MKALFLIVILFIQNCIAEAQAPHQSMPPPTNPGYSFTRGLYVDCSYEIVDDMINQNALGLQQQLTGYIMNNFISYVILCDLENSNVFGNHQRESSLRRLLIILRTSFPGIQIGLSGNTSAFFSTTGFIKADESASCYSASAISMQPLKSIVNFSGNNVNGFRKAELGKFFIRAMKLAGGTNPPSGSRCDATFDALYLENRYWNQTTSMPDMQLAFNEFKDALKMMQYLKCLYPCIKHIDAEFLPSDLFRLQGWTAIDQITDADPLADRLIVPVHTDNASGIFDTICKTFHFLSDRFSKPGSEIFLELSAESPSFAYCNSPATPQNHLGNYLNGSVTPSGNLFSVEELFLDKFNDSTYMCQSCSCFPYAEDHYTLSNPNANFLSGALWRPYSMMMDHNLAKERAIENSYQFESNPERIEVWDVNGRQITTVKFSSDIDIEDLGSGFYILKMIYPDENVIIRKVVIQK